MSVVKSEYDICYRMQEEQRVDDSNRTSGCLVSFDKSLCWVGAELEEIAQRVCPFTYCSSVPSCDLVAQQHMVTRRCASTGEWENTNYSECLTVVKEYQHCIQGYCRLCPDALRDLVITVSLTLSVLSVVVLVAAIVLFSIFKSLQCRRLSIHKNLASAFVFRFSVLAAWTIAQTTNAFQDCTKFHPQPLWNLGWICKGILWCVIYFQVASVMWMLIEGAYLYSRFTVFAMRHNEAPWSLFMLCGWGVPFVIVMAWTLVHEHKQEPNSFCWLPYAQGNHLWILAGSIGLALIMNLIFLLGIVTILVKKLRDERTAESKKIWRTIKSTLLLVPLLGISNIPLFYEPEKPSDVYMLGSAILQHSQGIFIAVLYCFLNGEIQNAVKRQFSKLPFQYFKKRETNVESERTYIPENRNVAGKHGFAMEHLNPRTTEGLSEETLQNKTEQTEETESLQTENKNEF